MKKPTQLAKTHRKRRKKAIKMELKETKTKQHNL